MTEQLKNDNASMPQQNEPDVFVLIKKMQQQLVFLEKKIDILINQSQAKPFREKQFSKPFRSFSRPEQPGRYHNKRDRGQDSREKNAPSGPRFEKHQGDENRGPGGPQKNYNDERENNSSHDRPFKKKYDGKNRGFDPRKKVFFHKRKEQ